MTLVRQSPTPARASRLTHHPLFRRLAAFVRRPGPRGGDGLLALTMVAVGIYLTASSVRAGDGPRITDVEPAPILLLPPPESGPTIWLVLPGVVAALALAWRRSGPITAFGIQVCAVLAASDDSDTNTAGVVAMAIGAYSVAAHVPRLLVAVTVFGGATVPLVAKFPGNDGPPGFVALAVMATMWAIGRTIGVWRTRAGAFHGRALRAEREREVAVARERARIARELHDVVSHSVSVMVIQSGAARMVLRTDPDAATEALRAVETSGRETMAELRHMLDVLSAPQDEQARRDGRVAPDGDALGPPLAPQPDLARLPVLLDRVRTAGLDVRLQTKGDARPLPPGIELTAYRVVQEALTNALKYAPGSHTAVTLTYTPDTVRVDVADDGPADGRRPEPLGAGRGLLGLTERVALHGGGFRTGHRPTGGYRVQASIPVPA